MIIWNNSTVGTVWAFPQRSSSITQFASLPHDVTVSAVGETAVTMFYMYIFTHEQRRTCWTSSSLSRFLSQMSREVTRSRTWPQRGNSVGLCGFLWVVPSSSCNKHKPGLHQECPAPNLQTRQGGPFHFKDVKNMPCHVSLWKKMAFQRQKALSDHPSPGNKPSGRAPDHS